MTEPTTPYSYQGESNLFNETPVIYASFWERFAAFIIDYIITWIASYFLQLAFGISALATSFSQQGEGFDTSESSGLITLTLGYILAVTITYWLYYALMHSGPWQATLGKRALGIKVTGMNGERISFLTATGRFFATILSFIIVLIGYFMMLWDDKKQTLHDKLAGTLVVKSK